MFIYQSTLSLYFCVYVLLNGLDYSHEILNKISRCMLEVGCQFACRYNHILCVKRAKLATPVIIVRIYMNTAKPYTLTPGQLMSILYLVHTITLYAMDLYFDLLRRNKDRLFFLVPASTTEDPSTRTLLAHLSSPFPFLRTKRVKFVIRNISFIFTSNLISFINYYYLLFLYCICA